ncbi:Mediator of RNA polymerase II transcription subunit 18 [Sugiyamaella lignohabitans]|uniref:Mediator of RNA polymerase II transcription subunit 18 n=1 Tax=Sugiyamaella lignohabitans TaxID=796027 RepID=A0A167C521_9ASCO|nr:Mediator of RNA polymerase II transcription subunit 18 [Sugiyamaella lignohabitans]ANB11225.1 Mediator of RNA polymerase II transcription subunit 18 [Sugiyamaella lignohabitans]
MMYQQLSLVGSLKDAEIKITLHTLAALSGMKPTRIFNHHLVWIPTYPFNPVLAAGEVNQIEQYRITCDTSLVDPASEDEYLPPAGFKENKDFLQTMPWKMIISEVPEAGKRQVTSQSILESAIVEGSPFEFMEKMGYKFSHEYWSKGSEFVFGNIVVRIFRICVKDQITAPTTEDQNLADTTEGSGTADNAMVIDDDSFGDKITAETALASQKAAYQPLKLLDKSGQWSIKAFLSVKQLTDLESIITGTAQLEKFQAEMAGLFELKMADRNSYDTRLRANR